MTKLERGFSPEIQSWFSIWNWLIHLSHSQIKWKNSPKAENCLIKSIISVWQRLLANQERLLSEPSEGQPCIKSNLQQMLHSVLNQKVRPFSKEGRDENSRFRQLLASTIRQEKIKGFIRTRKEETKLSLFIVDGWLAQNLGQVGRINKET